MSKKDKYTNQPPTIEMDDDDPRVPNTPGASYLLPSNIFACPGCGWLTGRPAGFDKHITGDADRHACRDYALKFPLYITLKSEEKTRPARSGGGTVMRAIGTKTSFFGQPIGSNPGQYIEEHRATIDANLAINQKVIDMLNVESRRGNGFVVTPDQTPLSEKDLRMYAMGPDMFLRGLSDQRRQEVYRYRRHHGIKPANEESVASDASSKKRKKTVRWQRPD